MTTDTDEIADVHPTAEPVTDPGFAAVRRHWVLVLFATVALAAVGVIIGVRRSPTYTASSQLNVGVPNAASQGTPGYEQAAIELASSYSREVESHGFAVAVGKRARTSVSTIEARVSATTVPTTTTFYVDATGSSPAEAIRLSRIGAATLVAQVNALARSSSSGKLLSRYRAEQATANQLNSVVIGLTGQHKRHPRRVTEQQVLAAQLPANVAALRAQALAERYTSSVSAGVETNLVVLHHATGVSSDRASVTERYGIVGALAGLVIGICLAVLSSGVRRRRAQRA